MFRWRAYAYQVYEGISNIWTFLIMAFADFIWILFYCLPSWLNLICAYCCLSVPQGSKDLLWFRWRMWWKNLTMTSFIWLVILEKRSVTVLAHFKRQATLLCFSDLFWLFGEMFFFPLKINECLSWKLLSPSGTTSFLVFLSHSGGKYMVFGLLLWNVFLFNHTGKWLDTVFISFFFFFQFFVCLFLAFYSFKFRP